MEHLITSEVIGNFIYLIFKNKKISINKNTIASTHIDNSDSDITCEIHVTSGVSIQFYINPEFEGTLKDFLNS